MIPSAPATWLKWSDITIYDVLYDITVLQSMRRPIPSKSEAKNQSKATVPPSQTVYNCLQYRGCTLTEK
jgi:hypothetical protein